MTASQLCTDVLVELGVIGAGETASAEDLDVVLRKLERLTDNWNADRMAIYADQLLTFTLTPSLQPHTLGASGGTWTVTGHRPVTIEGVQITLSSGDTYKVWPHDAAWWQGLTSPSLTSASPTDFYYLPGWPLGSLYLYPIPTSALSVQLLVRGVLSTYTLATTFTLPPGYRDAITLTLAEMCSGRPFGVALTPELQAQATKARARIFANNITVPKLCTQDAGMPSGGPTPFDYLTGGYWT